MRSVCQGTVAWCVNNTWCCSSLLFQQVRPFRMGDIILSEVDGLDSKGANVSRREPYGFSRSCSPPFYPRSRCEISTENKLQCPRVAKQSGLTQSQPATLPPVPRGDVQSQERARPQCVARVRGGSPRECEVASENHTAPPRHCIVGNTDSLAYSRGCYNIVRVGCCGHHEGAPCCKTNEQEKNENLGLRIEECGSVKSVYYHVPTALFLLIVRDCVKKPPRGVFCGGTGGTFPGGRCLEVFFPAVLVVLETLNDVGLQQSAVCAIINQSMNDPIHY